MSHHEPTVWRFDNANALYYALLDGLTAALDPIVRQGRKPVIALPTGNTMIPFYRLATDHEESLQISKWQCFNLDEYYPVTEKNESLSFESYMDLHFFSRLKQSVAYSRILNGRTKDPIAECKRFEEVLEERGGIDIALLGLGTNGHIAFNEPGSEFDTRTRLIELHPETQMANFSMRSSHEEKFTHAMTVGISTILSAKKIFIVALGKNKAQAVKCSIQDIESRSCPASVLRRHPSVTWFLDQEAAHFL